MLLDLLGEYIYMVYCLLAMKYLWNKEITRKYWRFLVVMAIMAGTSFLENQSNMKDLLMYPVEIICILYLVNGKRLINFIHFLIIEIVLVLLQRIAVYFIILIGVSDYSSILMREKERVLLYFCTIICLILFRNKIKKLSYYFNKISWYHLVLCIVIELCLLFFTAQAEIGMFFNGKRVANGITMGLLLLSCMIIISLIIIFIIVDINRKYYQMENKAKDEYLIIQEKYYRMLGYKDKEARKINHDLKAHLGCIEALLTEENYEEAKEYIKQLKDNTIKRIDMPFQSGNDIINAVLNDVAKEAEDYGTQIILTGALPKDIKISLPELCSLFHNLLSNSEEAMRNYQGNLPKEIYVNISFYKRSFGVVVKNPVTNPVNTEKLGKRYTSKRNKEIHGYGIENIKGIVEKYNGTLEFENKDGYFLSKIIFPDSINLSSSYYKIF
ncbi:MAG: GHKL domain-containing protein [Lachnospiraceae bacterium]|nr:GHKL domain-containing protein [Lachnospiraceae bacterium]